MKTYRIYGLDSNHRISGPPALVTVTDHAAAMVIALKSNTSPGGCEVWLGDQKVGQLSPWVDAEHASQRRQTSRPIS